MGKDYSKTNVSVVLPLILAILLVIVLLFSTYMMVQINNSIVKLKEAKRPAIVMLMGITAEGCSDCYDIDAVISKLENMNLNITSKDTIDWKNENAKELIQKYNIKKVPTLLVLGEIEKSSALTSAWSSYGEKVQDALVVTKQEPIYLDTATGKEVGRISAVYLTAEACNECIDRSTFVDSLKQSSIRFEEIKNVDVGTPEGLALADKYNISFAPTYVFSSDLGVYSIIQQNWDSVGNIETDGSYVLRYRAVPYYDLKEMKVRGLVSLIYLSDKSCKTCYNVSIHKQIFSNPAGFAMKIANESSYDISDAAGQALISKYSIVNVPTIIMQGDQAQYASLINVWPQVGTVEADGSYVFRNLDLLRATYKNLSSGKIINSSIPAPAP